MKRKKISQKHKQKKKRHKNYKGAAAQSARDRQEQVYDSYQRAADYLTGYNANINLLSNQLSFHNSPIYQPTLLSAFSGIQNQLSAFNSFENLLPNIDHLFPKSHVLDISRQATLAYSGLSNLETINDLTSIVSHKLPDWYNETILKNSFLIPQDYSSVDIFKTSQTLSEILGESNLSAFSIQSSLAKATEYSLYAEKSLSSFPWTDIGNKIGLTDTAKDSISDSFLGFSTDYSDLLKSFGSNPKSFAELSPALSKIAPIEYYTGANLLEAISATEEVTTGEELLKNEIQYENEYSLHKYLPQLNSGLLNMWKGAIETFNSNNSDKVRQFTVSLRELFGHVMHLLAPDDEIKKWSIEETYYEKGKPTRRARLHYICRNISNKPFNRFVEKDIQSTIEFIGIFQDGTHSIESGFTPQQLIAMKSKAETTLKFLLEIEFSANRQ